tara:strand:+ start:191 stop:838 length:648 start_codon:yes stop_codon:yes gene_type:complete
MAVASKVDICNLALDHLGKKTITSLDEGSTEAQACLRQYDIARRMCLARSPWTFARKLRSLALLATNDLSDTWQYHYDLPNDLLHLYRVAESVGGLASNAPPVPAWIESGTIYLNIETPKLLYVWDSEDTQAWSALFDDTVALFLAMRLSSSMTRRKSDTTALREAYTAMLGEAIEQDAQQEPSTYTFYEGGYTDARDAGGVTVGRQTDGSTIWG